MAFGRYWDDRTRWFYHGSETRAADIDLREKEMGLEEFGKGEVEGAIKNWDSGGGSQESRGMPLAKSAKFAKRLWASSRGLLGAFRVLGEKKWTCEA